MYPFDQVSIQQRAAERKSDDVLHLCFSTWLLLLSSAWKTLATGRLVDSRHAPALSRKSSIFCPLSPEKDRLHFLIVKPTSTMGKCRLLSDESSTTSAKVITRVCVLKSYVFPFLYSSGLRTSLCWMPFLALGLLFARFYFLASGFHKIPKMLLAP